MKECNHINTGGSFTYYGEGPGAKRVCEVCHLEEECYNPDSETLHYVQWRKTMEGQVAILSRKDVHQTILNFIHNNLQISREDIISVMEKKTEKVLELKLKELFSSKYFEGLIEKIIVSVIKQGVDDGLYGRTSFEKFITREISCQVHDMVSKKYEVKVEEKKG